MMKGGGTMNIEQLYYLKAIERTQSFSLAAQALYTSQQNLSNIVSRLEKRLNCKIFVRSKKGITLTPCGEVLMPKIDALLSQYEDLLAAFNDAHSEIRLIISSILTFDHFCDFFDVISRQSFAITITEDNSPENILDKVRERAARFGLIMLYHPLRSQLLQELCVVKYYDAPVGFLVPASHPLADRETVTFAECLQYPLVLDNENIVKNNILQYNLTQKKLSCPYTITAEVNISKLMAMIAHDHGCGFAAEKKNQAAYLEEQGLCLIPISDIPHAQASLIYRRDTLIGDHDRQLMAYLKRYFA